MLRDLIEAAAQWDLAPKPATLRWTNTYEPESGCHRFSFVEEFKILRYATNRSANKAFWKIF